MAAFAASLVLALLGGVGVFFGLTATLASAWNRLQPADRMEGMANPLDGRETGLAIDIGLLALFVICLSQALFGRIRDQLGGAPLWIALSVLWLIMGAGFLLLSYQTFNANQRREIKAAETFALAALVMLTMGLSALVVALI